MRLTGKSLFPFLSKRREQTAGIMLLTHMQVLTEKNNFSFPSVYIYIYIYICICTEHGECVKSSIIQLKMTVLYVQYGVGIRVHVT